MNIWPSLENTIKFIKLYELFLFGLFGIIKMTLFSKKQKSDSIQIFTLIQKKSWAWITYPKANFF